MFNDDDLAELRGRIPDLKKFLGYKIAISSQRLSDLLDRLEAAEKYATYMRTKHPGWYNSVYEAWLKECGKESK